MGGFDFNDAPEQRVMGNIPDGSFVHLKLAIRPGGIDGEETIDKGLLKASKTSDVLMLDTEMTVLDGKHAKQKIWQNMVVSGGSVDDKGNSKGWNVTKTTLRAMIESALAIHPNDMSPDAKTKRQMRGFADFDGIEFWAKTGLEKQDGYPERTTISSIITPADAEYALLREGKEVEPKPSGVRKASAAKPAAAAAGNQPAWAKPAGAQAASPPPPPAAGNPNRPAWAK